MASFAPAAFNTACTTVLEQVSSGVNANTGDWGDSDEYAKLDARKVSHGTSFSNANANKSHDWDARAGVSG